MNERLEKDQLALLIGTPAFRMFLWRVIQTSGIYAATTNGTDGRHLLSEGRRTLGLDILRDAARGVPMDDPEAALSLLLIQVHREAAQAIPEEKPVGRRQDRYDEDAEQSA